MFLTLQESVMMAQNYASLPWLYPILEQYYPGFFFSFFLSFLSLFSFFSFLSFYFFSFFLLFSFLSLSHKRADDIVRVSDQSGIFANSIEKKVSLFLSFFFPLTLSLFSFSQQKKNRRLHIL